MQTTKNISENGNKWLALSLLALGLLCNKWLLAYGLATDRPLESVTLTAAIYAFQCLLIGLSVAVWRLRSRVNSIYALALAGPAIFVAGVLVDSCVRFSSTISMTSTFLVYFGLWLAAIATYRAALRRWSNLKPQLALAGYSTVVCLLVGEVFLVVASDSSVQPKNAEFDTRSKREVVLALRSRGINAVPSIHPHGFYSQDLGTITIDGAAVIPLGGLSNRQTVFCNETGRYLVFCSDEYGFHNPRGLYDSRRLDIAVLGDSFAQGACVCSEDNAVSRIRASYPNTLTFGSAANGPLTTLATLREYALPLRPRFILWWFYEGNDLDDLKLEIACAPLRRYLEDDYAAGLIDVQDQIDQQLEAVAEDLLVAGSDETAQTAKRQRPIRVVYDALTLTSVRSKMRGLAQDLLSRADSAGGSSVDTGGLETILSMAKRETETAGAEFIFVYLPASSRYVGRSNLPWLDRLDATEARVASMVENLGIRFVNVHDRFEQAADPADLFTFRGGHYSSEGYRVLADAILAELGQQPR